RRQNFSSRAPPGWMGMELKDQFRDSYAAGREAYQRNAAKRPWWDRLIFSRLFQLLASWRPKIGSLITAHSVGAGDTRLRWWRLVFFWPCARSRWTSCANPQAAERLLLGFPLQWGQRTDGHLYMTMYVII